MHVGEQKIARGVEGGTQLVKRVRVVRERGIPIGRVKTPGTVFACVRGLSLTARIRIRIHLGKSMFLCMTSRFVP